MEDVKVLQQLCRQTFAETFQEQNTEEDLNKFLDEAYALPILEKEIADEDSKIFLAYGDQGHAIGYLKINRGAAQTEEGYDNSLEIQRIYMLKEAKGQGVGSKFMQLAEEQAKAWGLSYVWLGVWEHNYAAQKFYTGKGFEKFSQHVFVVGEDAQTDFLMKKAI